MRLILYVFLVALTGCVTTSSGHLNPGYTGFSANKFALVVLNKSHDQALKVETEVLDLLAESDVEVKGFTNWIPFTTEDVLTAKIKDEGFLYALVFQTTSDYGREATGSYSYSGTSGYGYNSGTVTEKTSAYRDTKAGMRLYDVQSLDVIWTGEAERNSIGAFAVFDLSAESEIVAELVEKLMSSGVISSG